MDLSDADTACASVLHVRCLLERAKNLNDAIDTPDNYVARVDNYVFELASDTYYSEQPHGTTKREDRPPAFPRLLAAFEAAVEKVATPAQKKKRDDTTNAVVVFNYQLTHFLSRIIRSHPQLLRALKLALHADVKT